jgi:hypothetical protein
VAAKLWILSKAEPFVEEWHRPLRPVGLTLIFCEVRYCESAATLAGGVVMLISVASLIAEIYP